MTMKRFFNYIVAMTMSVVLSSCSAAYWSGTSFEGNDMYGVHAPVVVSSTRYQTVPNEVSVESTTTYTYQRPESYYQYQYVSADNEAEVVSYDPSTYTAELVDSSATVVIDPKYVSSTYGVWEEEEVVASNVYVNVTYSYNPWWGYGYDPFYYNPWGYPYRYSHYYNHYLHHYNPYYPPFYGGWYGPVHGGGGHVSKRPKQNIVSLPSSGGGSTSTRVPGSNASSKSYRGQSVGTTTSSRFNRATTTYNSNNNSSSSSSKSPSTPSSSKTTSSSSTSSKSTTTTYSAPVRPTTTNSSTISSPTRSISTPSSSSSGSSSRTSSGGGVSSR